MEKYKKIIINRMLIVLSVLLFAIVLLIMLSFNGDKDEHTISYLWGVVCGLGGVSIVTLIINYRLLKNETKLKEKYISEMDERNLLIGQKVESLCFKLFVFVIAIMSLFFASFDSKTSTLLASLLSLALVIKVGLYLYYKKKL